MLKNESESFFKSMMQAPPNYNKGGGTFCCAPFKYKYTDIKCGYCAEKKLCNTARCPYILDNIADLTSDENFIKALINFKHCKTKHKNTLKFLLYLLQTEPESQEGRNFFDRIEV